MDITKRTEFTSRNNFAAVVRDAIRRGTLTSYERDHWMGRTAVLADGRIISYDPRPEPTHPDDMDDWRADCAAVNAEQARRGR